jgi:ribose transport system substrate-binding protein
MTAMSAKRIYLIPVLSKALQILELLRSANQPQSVDSIQQETQFARSTVYRILKTLAHYGYVSHTPDGQYRIELRPRILRIGYANLSAVHPIAKIAEASLRLAASAAGIDLLVLNNQYDAAQTIANAEEFIRERVQLVIEFQVDEKIAPLIADKFSRAEIPLIAVGMPHPHAVFVGINDFRCGFDAGQCLGRHALAAWDGEVDWVLGMTLGKAGPVVQSRITGAFEGVRSKVRKIGDENFITLDDDGRPEESYKLVSQFLRRHSKDRRILVASVSDTSALGAVRAVRELKRMKDVAIVGQDCIPEALEEMSSPGSPMIGSVAHHTDKGGPEIIRIALAILNGESVPPYIYLPHDLVTATSLQQSKSTAKRTQRRSR